MKKIYITRPIPGGAVEILKSKGFEVVMNKKNSPLDTKSLIKELKKNSYDGIISLLHDKIDSKVFDAAPSVKIFSNYAVGYNNIDIDEAKKRGIVVTNTPSDMVNESVAEHTFAMILALSSRIVEGDAYVRKNKYKGWDPNLLIGTDIKGKTLGVIGAGRIGTYVAQKAVFGFGMNVVYFDIRRNEKIEGECKAVFKDRIEDVFKEADFVTLHVLLDETTKHLVNKDRLALMKKSACIVNTSRGPVVDEKALFQALVSGQIKGAALDVFENEPKITKGLLKLPNVVLTPHIASATEATRGEMSRLAAEAVVDFFNGKRPANQVN